MASTKLTPSHPEHIRNIAKDIIFTILTCGIYNLYVQYKQIEALNAMLGQRKYDFLTWFLLTLVTCGLYHIYHEYRLSEDLMKLLKLETSEPLLAVVLTTIGFGIVADAIQQSHINHFYGDTSL